MTAVRIRSARAPYRRAGLEFGTVKEWVDFPVPGEWDAHAAAQERHLRLLADPVLDIEYQLEPDGAFEPAPAELRAEAQRVVMTLPVEDWHEAMEAWAAAEGERQNTQRESAVGEAPAEPPAPPAAATADGDGVSGQTGGDGGGDPAPAPTGDTQPAAPAPSPVVAPVPAKPRSGKVRAAMP
jgi:hypothetical protein